MSRPSVEAIIANWIRWRLGDTTSLDIASHEVETVPEFARNYHFTTVLASTVTRKWRKIRENGALSAEGLTVSDVSNEYPNRIENTWRIEWKNPVSLN